MTVRCLSEYGADPYELTAEHAVYYRLLVTSYRSYNGEFQTSRSQELKEMGVLFRSYGAVLSVDQLNAFQKKDGIELSKEDIEGLFGEPKSGK